MRAQVGDRVTVRSNKVGTPDRTGEVVEVRGKEGAPPYRVRWSDGHESLFTPGPDAAVRSKPASRKR